MTVGAVESAAPGAVSGREPAGMDVASIVAGLLAAFALVVAASLAVEALYFRAARIERARLDTVVVPASTVSPRAQQSQLLRGYRWVDEKAGVVSLPIERAMELVVQRTDGTAGGTGR